MLERFLKSPAQSPDPTARVEALLALPVDDPQFLKSLIEDSEPSVRARLLGKVTDLGLLDERRRNDQTPAVIDAARVRLRTLLGDSEECEDAARAAFIEQSDDPDILYFAALNAPQPATRRAAFARHQDHAENHDILRVAIASRETDEAFRAEACKGLDDVGLMEKVAALTKKSDKGVYRYAREWLRATRETQAATERAGELADELKQRAAKLMSATNEALHRSVALQQKWREEFDDLGKIDGVTLPDVATDLKVLDERHEQSRALIAKRAAILESIASSQTDQNLDADDLRKQWDALPDHSPREDKLFEQALALDAAQRKKLIDRANLVARASALITRFDPETEGKGSAASLAKDWSALNLTVDDADESGELTARYTALHAKLAARDKQNKAAEERATTQAQALIEQLETSLEAGQIASATSACDKLAHRLRHKKDLPSDVAAKLDKRMAVLEPRLKELKQARVWSTQQAREELIVEVEALAAQADGSKPKALADKVKALRSKWRELDHGVGPAHEDIWKRFDGGCEAAYAPAKAHFDQEASERKENAARKREICEKLEAFEKDSDWTQPDWEGAAKVVNASRKAWREAGPVNHRQFQKLRQRLDAAMKPIESHLEEESQREVRRRELAIASLEKSIEKDPLDQQIDLAKRIQREWRPTVRARRRKEQDMWESLRKLCDGVFASRDEKFAGRKAAESEAMAERKAICAELDTLVGGGVPADDEAVRTVNAAYAALKERWRNAGDVHPKQRNAVAGRYRDACKKLDGLRADVKRRARAMQAQSVLQRLRLVDERWRALARGDDSPVDADAWSALTPTKGATGKKLDAAFTSAPNNGAEDVRLDLCLRAELAADVPSPPDVAAQRMALKVEQLKNAMAGATPPPPAEAVNEFIEQWLDAPVAGDGALFGRFAVALDALAHRR
ncbi:MAG: DUF349 domain-containing protein [Gammaproteobacteria bacterium]